MTSPSIKTILRAFKGRRLTADQIAVELNAYIDDVAFELFEHRELLVDYDIVDDDLLWRQYNGKEWEEVIR